MQLLEMAGRCGPPVVLLEDGLGTGATILAWGAKERLRLPWADVHLGALESFDPGDGWIGAIAYDLGLPPRAVRRDPVLEVPVVELFRPERTVVVKSGERGARASVPPGLHASVPALVTSQLTFEASVRRALRHIRDGDIYQANLSVAHRVPLVGTAWDAYLRLRAINPSPWMGYADFGDWQLVCGSPELLVEVHGMRATARPIAGTRRRRGDPAHDAAMRAELEGDEKEAAEHVMLVDLARNDLGRIARYGSVRVAAFRRIEVYSHVMHLVSDVEAELRPGLRPWDAFRALFPGGTITGCPKIRAMEIIADLEPVARGMYTGALGWWERDAGQWNILIRSAVVRGREAVLQAGAGIVADSDPEREWKESLRKAAALRAAFGAQA